MHTINLSVAVWVGFLALFGIASDNGVVIATYLDQSFARSRPDSIDEIREATVAGAVRRIRPCLMTSATTILALIPVLTSIGRGSDMMVPMAIPSFGGMMVVLVSVFMVPVFYCAIKEFRHVTGWSSMAVGVLMFATLSPACWPPWPAGVSQPSSCWCWRASTSAWCSSWASRGSAAGWRRAGAPA